MINLTQLKTIKNYKIKSNDNNEIKNKNINHSSFSTSNICDNILFPSEDVIRKRSVSLRGTKDDRGSWEVTGSDINKNEKIGVKPYIFGLFIVLGVVFILLYGIYKLIQESLAFYIIYR
jgi:hypothetical protein